MRLLFVLLFLSACSFGPKKETKVFETFPRKLSPEQAELLKRPIYLTEEDVVIDARSAFSYASAHVPGAIHLEWQDLSSRSIQGALAPDLFAVARNLARRGLDPETRVLVLGNSVDGQGEEGRIAWTLMYMGVKNVEIFRESVLDFKRVHQDLSPPAKAKAIWKPRFDTSLKIGKKALLDELSQKNSRTVFIDVRSPAEYAENYIGSKPLPEMNAINIEWCEFFQTETGRPDPEMAEKLYGLGIHSKRKIVVLSRIGLRSAAVNYALRKLGFENSSTFPGGLVNLIE